MSCFVLLKNEQELGDIYNSLQLFTARQFNGDELLTAFPFIIDTQLKIISDILPGVNLPINAPAFCIKERNIDRIFPVNDISSGMQKMFLLILDTILMEDQGLLLIDEYENSLGINAIHFFPDLLEVVGDSCQFIMTSHHPYIINNIDISSWKVFYRNGLDVEILNGESLKQKFLSSKQEHFTQLINNKFYSEGIA
ncbi:MAG: AAA family ATPase [Salinispira sp.]